MAGTNKPAVYKGITFQEDYNKSLADFEKEFGKTHVFRNLKPSERQAALKEAHKIATNGNAKATTTASQNAK